MSKLHGLRSPYHTASYLAWCTISLHVWPYRRLPGGTALFIQSRWGKIRGYLLHWHLMIDVILLFQWWRCLPKRKIYLESFKVNAYSLGLIVGSVEEGQCQQCRMIAGIRRQAFTRYRFSKIRHFPNWHVAFLSLHLLRTHLSLIWTKCRLILFPKFPLNFAVNDRWELNFRIIFSYP